MKVPIPYTILDWTKLAIALPEYFQVTEGARPLDGPIATDKLLIMVYRDNNASMPHQWPNCIFQKRCQYELTTQLWRTTPIRQYWGLLSNPLSESFKCHSNNYATTLAVTFVIESVMDVEEYYRRWLYSGLLYHWNNVCHRRDNGADIYW